ncbi:MAG: dihydrodipicolinate synthase family protein [Planctomycetaceae bacterium]|nr:dihydrodipicolinate synthase family protein [Planctomycetales bacterium]MCB9925778.1 dihydrodipicolinate synthase family protein [Planctomycetaceae bacterium]
MTEPRFRLIAPPTTPFHTDGSLNLDAVERQAQLLIDTTVDGVFVAGSTGEGQSLSTEERMKSAKRWIDVAGGTELEVIVQVGHNSLPDAISLAAHAQQIGADSIAASSPCYFKPARVEELIDFLTPVAAAAGDLPFYFYEIPPLTNVALPMAEFLEKAKPRIPNLVGLKYSNIDLMQMQQCVQMSNGEFEVLFGSDQQLLAAVALGACGAVGSTYNFAAPLYRRMLAEFAKGNHEAARKLQAKSVEIVAIMARHCFLSACKILLTELGIENGPVRAPLRNLTNEQRQVLLSDLHAAGVFELQVNNECESAKQETLDGK